MSTDNNIRKIYDEQRNHSDYEDSSDEDKEEAFEEI